MKSPQRRVADAALLKYLDINAELRTLHELQLDCLNRWRASDKGPKDLAYVRVIRWCMLTRMRLAALDPQAVHDAMGLLLAETHPDTAEEALLDNATPMEGVLAESIVPRNPPEYATDFPITPPPQQQPLNRSQRRLLERQRKKKAA